MNNNVDASELTKFSALATDWWDPSGQCRPLHDLNPTRLQFILDRCPLSQKTVLDIGCGGGILAESMSARGAVVTGIDAAADVVDIAKQHAAENKVPRLNYELATAEEYAQKNAARFDVVTCMELLEHVPDPLSLIKACVQLVKPEGHLFFSTLNRSPKAYLFAILGAEYLLNLLPKGTHQYEKFIRPSELELWFRQSGLQLKELSGIHYNPFTRRATLNTDVNVNYIAHATSSP